MYMTQYYRKNNSYRLVDTIDKNSHARNQSCSPVYLFCWRCYIL